MLSNIGSSRAIEGGRGTAGGQGNATTPQGGEVGAAVKRFVDRLDYLGHRRPGRRPYPGTAVRRRCRARDGRTFSLRRASIRAKRWSHIFRARRSAGTVFVANSNAGRGWGRTSSSPSRMPRWGVAPRSGAEQPVMSSSTVAMHPPGLGPPPQREAWGGKRSRGTHGTYHSIGRCHRTGPGLGLRHRDLLDHKWPLLLWLSVKVEPRGVTA